MITSNKGTKDWGNSEVDFETAHLEVRRENLVVRQDNIPWFVIPIACLFDNKLKKTQE